MGDQIGNAVGGTLYYVPLKEFERIQSLDIGDLEKTSIFASLCRINTLYMIARAGSGHIGSSFSSMEIMAWLLLNELRIPQPNDNSAPRDIFFSSKGHDAPGLYSTWIGTGMLEFENIHHLRKLNGLPGHPDISIENVVTNTGSLGMGISKAKGMIMANRHLKREGNIYVLTGDGELQEGQFWESLISAVNFKLNELTVIIDHNKLQSDTLVKKVSDLGDLEAKLKAFGWHVNRCDGNDLMALSKSLEENKKITDKPKIIIADTIKGKGVSFMEHSSIDSDVELYKFHSGAPSEESYNNAVNELLKFTNELMVKCQTTPLQLESNTKSIISTQTKTQRLIPAYSEALIQEAEKNTKIMVLDADLVLDTGLIPFQEKFSNRFIECGIAEQDMVSQAGGMALNGIIPIVHSFSCFLSARPNEQIYNNATERTKVIYIGSLAGLLPAGPGHSHQAVRDITALGAVPNLIMMEPSNEKEVGKLLSWAINRYEYSSYLRMVSIPCEINYRLPDNYEPEMGKGVILRDGEEMAIIAYGPVMLSEAIKAADELKNENDINVKVISMPWLNYIDQVWLENAMNQITVLVTLDNQYSWAGLGQQIRSSLYGSKLAGNIKMSNLGINGIPVCGTNKEVLEHHNLDKKTIKKALLNLVSKN